MGFPGRQKVIAIVDGGRIGLLEFHDTKGPPFELDVAKMSVWKLVQHQRQVLMPPLT